MKKSLCFIISFVLLLTLTACGKESSPSASAETVPLSVAAVDTTILLDGTGAEVNGGGAQFSDGVVTISTSGTYHIRGTGNNIQIRVEAGESASVVLSLEGANIVNTENDAILTEGTGSVTIVMGEGTENTAAYLPAGSSTAEETSAESE